MGVRSGAGGFGLGVFHDEVFSKSFFVNAGLQHWGTREASFSSLKKTENPGNSTSKHRRRYPDDEEWYPGTIDKVNDDGTYKVKWLDPEGGPVAWH